MNDKKDYRKILDNNIMWLFRRLIGLSLSFPSYIPFTVKSLFSQIKGIELRKRFKKESLEVPPVIISSITNRCNLGCKGCYNKLREGSGGSGIEIETFVKMLEEAMEIGSRIVFLSGGEPMTRPDILSVTTDFPEILFPLFTNGLLVGESNIKAWKKQKNIIPIISLEGDESDTDGRRGNGVYRRVKEISAMLKKAGIIFGHSMTASRWNYKLLTDLSYIKGLYDSGARIFIFVEYQDVDGQAPGALINGDEIKDFRNRISRLRNSMPGLIIQFPGEEEQYGGCLSAGRGFVHISAEASLEPCPFSPYSDENLKTSGLKLALKSKLLNRIRERHYELAEISGCALLQKKDWVKSLL